MIWSMIWKQSWGKTQLFIVQEQSKGFHRVDDVWRLNRRQTSEKCEAVKIRGCEEDAFKIGDQDGKWHEEVTYNVVFR